MGLFICKWTTLTGGSEMWDGVVCQLLHVKQTSLSPLVTIMYVYRLQIRASSSQVEKEREHKKEGRPQNESWRVTCFHVDRQISLLRYFPSCRRFLLFHSLWGWFVSMSVDCDITFLKRYRRTIYSIIFIWPHWVHEFLIMKLFFFFF